MSYYPQQTGQPTTGTYPYGTYAAGTYAQAGAYPYGTSAYPSTSVTSYGSWGYYSYYQNAVQRQAAGSAQSPQQATPAPAYSATGSTTPTVANASSQATQRAYSAYNPSYARESVAAAATGGAVGRGPYKKQAHYRGLFAKELRSLMYGFGDDRNPANDTVNVMEEILVEYITDMCQVALAPTKKNRLSVDDFRRALSRPADSKKFARMEELLFMQEDIKRARAMFNDSEGTNPAQALHNA